MKKEFISTAIATFLAATTLAGCNPARQREDNSNFSYDIDTRTGICVLHYMSGDRYTSAPNPVKCTDNILKLINPAKIDQLKANGVTPVLDP